jgi:DNA repair exonuclease SbcCD ATPase subunit
MENGLELPDMTRLMCSTQQEEVGAVKSELFRAGIRSEIRSNPLAAALNVTRLELWVENDNDYLAAQKFYANMQAGSRNGDEWGSSKDTTATSVDAEHSAAPSTRMVSRGTVDPDGKNKNQRPGGELEQASLLLEKEIEEVLEREDALSETCTNLRSEVERLNQSLSESQTASEKATEEFTALRKSLEGELMERMRSEDLLKGEVRNLQSRLKLVEATLSEKQQRLETTLHQLQNQQSMVVELRKEIVSREQEWDENKRQVSKAHAELAVERQSRIAAEEKLAKSAVALERLVKQLAEQKDLQEQLRVSIENLNSLRDRLHAKRTSVRV